MSECLSREFKISSSSLFGLLHTQSPQQIHLPDTFSVHPQTFACNLFANRCNFAASLPPLQEQIFTTASLHRFSAMRLAASAFIF